MVHSLVTDEADTYGGVSPNDFPMYGIRDASRCLKIASATLRSWFVGTNRGTFPPVLEPAATGPLKLSFNNLAEAYVLRSLRTEHEVKLDKIRSAIIEAQEQLDISRLLLNRGLKAHAGDLLIEKFGQYLMLGRSGQLAMRELLKGVLERFIWEEENFPSTILPFVPYAHLTDKVIAINPRRSFGAPHLHKRGITTAIIAMRFNAGESMKELAADYRVPDDQIRTAIVYEEAA